MLTFTALDPATLAVAGVAVALRAAWLLPDWIAKWRALARTDASDEPPPPDPRRAPS